jgi:hypothetical protein
MKVNLKYQIRGCELLTNGVNVNSGKLKGRIISTTPTGSLRTVGPNINQVSEKFVGPESFAQLETCLYANAA